MEDAKGSNRPAGADGCLSQQERQHDSSDRKYGGLGCYADGTWRVGQSLVGAEVDNFNGRRTQNHHDAQQDQRAGHASCAELRVTRQHQKTVETSQC